MQADVKPAADFFQTRVRDRKARTISLAGHVYATSAHRSTLTFSSGRMATSDPIQRFNRNSGPTRNPKVTVSGHYESPLGFCKPRQSKKAEFA